MHTGTVINDLYATVDNALALRESSVDGAEPWGILVNARTHLCIHEMTQGDVQAWYLLADLQDEVISAPVQCQAAVGRDQNVSQCGEVCVEGT